MIPDDWEERTLQNCARGIVRGASPRPIDDPKWFDDRSPVGWLRISDVTSAGRFLTTTTQRLSDAGIRHSRKVPAGSLVMSICATVGRPIETRIDVCIHDGFVLFDKPDVEQDFLYHVLTDLEPRWTKKGQTGSQMNLNTGLIKGTKIAVPKDGVEQSAIATTLSDVDALLAAQDALIAKKRAIKQGAMQELLTGKRRLPGFCGEWEVRRLGEIAHIKTGSRNNEHKVEGGDYPFFVRSEFVERIDGYSYDCEAILVPGEGKIGEIFHYITGRFDVHQRVYAITQFAANVSGQFVHLFMKASFGQWAMQNTVKATVDSLRLPTFQNFQMRLPPTKDEQVAIAKALSDMDAEITGLETQRAKTAQLKQGMMQELLTGRIRLV